ncbi:transcription factor with AP2 domain(s), putative [Plasmodium gallinaceum]|uniref:Transcription factor with AP2 domain(S), putative n=1 Tax=Plasmodium gallinaceum TaxID=5849 RepID=A0A1J1H392_PLAGA|nr:transcription factor with AP2 domain(s), putative [Plasmodium gallinaceum]CRG97957.1 transcription factor with AP2 domain(s), putative [Plasmodium gallinaceum]
MSEEKRDIKKLGMSNNSHSLKNINKIQGKNKMIKDICSSKLLNDIYEEKKNSCKDLLQTNSELSKNLNLKCLSHKYDKIDLLYYDNKHINNYLNEDINSHGKYENLKKQLNKIICSKNKKKIIGKNRNMFNLYKDKYKVENDKNDTQMPLAYENEMTILNNYKNNSKSDKFPSNFQMSSFFNEKDIKKNNIYEEKKNGDREYFHDSKCFSNNNYMKEMSYGDISENSSLSTLSNKRIKNSLKKSSLNNYNNFNNEIEIEYNKNNKKNVKFSECMGYMDKNVNSKPLYSIIYNNDRNNFYNSMNYRKNEDVNFNDGSIISENYTCKSNLDELTSHRNIDFNNYYHHSNKSPIINYIGNNENKQSHYSNSFKNNINNIKLADIKKFLKNKEELYNETISSNNDTYNNNTNVLDNCNIKYENLINFYNSSAVARFKDSIKNNFRNSSTSSQEDSLNHKNSININSNSFEECKYNSHLVNKDNNNSPNSKEIYEFNKYDNNNISNDNLSNINLHKDKNIFKKEKLANKFYALNFLNISENGDLDKKKKKKKRICTNNDYIKKFYKKKKQKAEGRCEEKSEEQIIKEKNFRDEKNFILRMNQSHVDNEEKNSFNQKNFQNIEKKKNVRVKCLIEFDEITNSWKLFWKYGKIVVKKSYSKEVYGDNSRYKALNDLENFQNIYDNILKNNPDISEEHKYLLIQNKIYEHFGEKYYFPKITEKEKKKKKKDIFDGNNEQLDNIKEENIREGKEGEKEDKKEDKVIKEKGQWEKEKIDKEEKEKEREEKEKYKEKVDKEKKEEKENGNEEDKEKNETGMEEEKKKEDNYDSGNNEQTEEIKNRKRKYIKTNNSTLLDHIKIAEKDKDKMYIEKEKIQNINDKIYERKDEKIEEKYEFNTLVNLANYEKELKILKKEEKRRINERKREKKMKEIYERRQKKLKREEEKRNKILLKEQKKKLREEKKKMKEEERLRKIEEKIKLKKLKQLKPIIEKINKYRSSLKSKFNKEALHFIKNKEIFKKDNKDYLDYLNSFDKPSENIFSLIKASIEEKPLTKRERVIELIKKNKNVHINTNLYLDINSEDDVENSNNKGNWIVSWVFYGRTYRKKFSINEYGFKKAKELAENYKNERINCILNNFSKYNHFKEIIQIKNNQINNEKDNADSQELMRNIEQKKNNEFSVKYESNIQKENDEKRNIRCTFPYSKLSSESKDHQKIYNSINMINFYNHILKNPLFDQYFKNKIMWVNKLSCWKIEIMKKQNNRYIREKKYYSEQKYGYIIAKYIAICDYLIAENNILNNYFDTKVPNLQYDNKKNAWKISRYVPHQLNKKNYYFNISIYGWLNSRKLALLLAIDLNENKTFMYEDFYNRSSSEHKNLIYQNIFLNKNYNKNNSNEYLNVENNINNKLHNKNKCSMSSFGIKSYSTSNNSNNCLDISYDNNTKDYNKEQKKDSAFENKLYICKNGSINSNKNDDNKNNIHDNINIFKKNIYEKIDEEKGKRIIQNDYKYSDDSQNNGKQINKNKNYIKMDGYNHCDNKCMKNNDKISCNNDNCKCNNSTLSMSNNTVNNIVDRYKNLIIKDTNIINKDNNHNNIDNYYDEVTYINNNTNQEKCDDTLNDFYCELRNDENDKIKKEEKKHCSKVVDDSCESFINLKIKEFQKKNIKKNNSEHNAEKHHKDKSLYTYNENTLNDNAINKDNNSPNEFKNSYMHNSYINFKKLYEDVYNEKYFQLKQMYSCNDNDLINFLSNEEDKELFLKENINIDIDDEHFLIKILEDYYYSNFSRKANKIKKRFIK